MSKKSPSIVFVDPDGEPPPIDGFYVEAVADRSAVVDRLDRPAVDCLVLGGDSESSMETLELVQRHSREVPTVFVAREDETLESALEAGATEVLRGSASEVSPGVLSARISSALHRSPASDRCIDPVLNRGRILGEAIDVLDDVVYVVDDEYGLVAWNRTLPERLGYTDDEMAGMTGAEVYPEEQWAEAVDDETKERENEDRIVEMDLVGADGERIPHEFRSEWYHDERTGKNFRVGIAREVTERHRFERELRRRNDRLVEFTERLVTEIRGCLAVGYAATDPSIADDQEGYEEVEAVFDRIDRILENARELARAGRAVVSPSPVELGEAAASAWADLEHAGGTLEVDAEGYRVECDPARLRRLLVELFQNAVEHAVGSTNDGVESTERSLTVRVGVLENGFYVADDGLGLPPAEYDLVFDRGYSTDNDREGFGLAIVDEIATAHDWTVDVCQAEDGGACIEVRGVEIQRPE